MGTQVRFVLARVCCLSVLTFGNICQIQGLTYISVGHRPSLLAYHDVKLRLKEQGYDFDKILQKDSVAAESSL